MLLAVQIEYNGNRLYDMNDQESLHPTLFARRYLLSRDFIRLNAELEVLAGFAPSISQRANK